MALSTGHVTQPNTTIFIIIHSNADSSMHCMLIGKETADRTQLMIELRYDRIGSDWIGLVGIHRKRKEVAVDVPSADKESAIRRAESTDADGNGHEKCQSSQSSTSERLQPQRESINTLKDSSSRCHSSTTRQSVQSISSMLVEAPSSLNQSINQWSSRLCNRSRFNNSNIDDNNNNTGNNSNKCQSCRSKQERQRDKEREREKERKSGWKGGGKEGGQVHFLPFGNVLL